MQKQNKLFSIILGLFMLLFVGSSAKYITYNGGSVVNTAKATTNYGLNALLAQDTFKFPYQEREDDLVLEFAEPIAEGIKITYEVIGNDSSEFESYKKAFKKKYTSQTTIGKFIRIKMYSISYTETGEEKLEPVTSNASVNVKIYLAGNLRNKHYYLVSCGSVTDFRAIDERGFSYEDGYINLKTSIGPGLTLAVIYDKSYVIVVLCIVGFLVVLGVCIFIKIYRIRKSDPEYYQKVKKEKQKEKQQRSALKEYDKRAAENHKNKKKKKKS